MSRIRSVKPRLFVSPSMAKVSIPARYLFVGLFTEADDEGRLLDSPKQIAGNLFPHDEAVTARKVKGWLDELAEVGSIERYTDGQTAYLCLPTFLDHQRISKATPSILPAPPGAAPEFPREIREFPGAAPELPRPEVEVEVEVEQGNTLGRLPPPGFPEFYEAFPNKRARLAAEKAFRTACRRAPPEVIIAAAERFRDDPNLPADRSKIPYPASWLNAGRWEDDPLPEQNGQSRHRLDQHYARLRQASREN